MVRVIRYRVYAVYDFEDDVITIVKTVVDANRIAKYYGEARR